MPLRVLAVTATVGMFLVLVMGATVTSTGSAQGCGQSWPLCNGQLIPEFTVATAIEYSHRAVTGVEGLLVVLLAVGVLVNTRRPHTPPTPLAPRDEGGAPSPGGASPPERRPDERHLAGGGRLAESDPPVAERERPVEPVGYAQSREREVWVLVGLMLGFLVLQAGLGAWAVLAPQSPLVLASHFGISLIAFASVFLTMVRVFDGPGRNGTVPGGYRWAVLGITAYVLGVVYLGAYVRHAGVSLACADWPLCNGNVWPGFEGPSGVVFAHRLAALGAVLLLGWLAAWSWHLRTAAPELATGSLAAFGLGLTQVLSGAVVVWSHVGVFSTLAHAAIVALLFTSLAFLVRRVVAVGRPVSFMTESGRAQPAAAGARP